MSGIEQAFWEAEKWFWIAVIFGAGAMAFFYIAKIVADIKEEGRHKKLMKKWEKEDKEKPQDTALYASLRR